MSLGCQNLDTLRTGCVGDVGFGMDLMGVCICGSGFGESFSGYQNLVADPKGLVMAGRVRNRSVQMMRFILCHTFGLCKKKCEG